MVPHFVLIFLILVSKELRVSDGGMDSLPSLWNIILCFKILCENFSSFEYTDGDNVQSIESILIYFIYLIPTFKKKLQINNFFCRNQFILNYIRDILLIIIEIIFA